MNKFEFFTKTKSSLVIIDEDEELPVNGLYVPTVISTNEVRFKRKYGGLREFLIDVSEDEILIDSNPFTGTTAQDLYDAVEAIFFLDENGNVNGFIDYNDTTGSFAMPSDTWTDLPNNGAGAFTNKQFPPTGVTELVDVSTGYIDPTQLTLGDAILIRNDYTINPNTNNAQLKFRYELGNGGGLYTLEKIIGRLDSGSGQDYRFSLSPDLIYMGDTNTRDNPIKIQVYCTSNATVTNAGSVIQVIKR